ncbi:MAG: VOC family protein [Planctomycetes bacterium]|nr:VOC family protein [Planctomycetota bacterium]
MPICTHVAFRVHDLEKTIRFYEQVLPGKVIARRHGRDFWRSEIAWIEPQGHQGFTLVAIQPTRVRWLLWLFHTFVPRQTRSYEHMGFACATKDEFFDRVRVAQRSGARVLVPPTWVDEQVGHVFEVVDPDRNSVEWTFDQRFG